MCSVDVDNAERRAAHSRTGRTLFSSQAAANTGNMVRRAVEAELKRINDLDNDDEDDNDDENDDDDVIR